MLIHPVDVLTKQVNPHNVEVLQGFPTDVDGRSHAILVRSGVLLLQTEFLDYVTCLADQGGKCAICIWGGKPPAER